MLVARLLPSCFPKYPLTLATPPALSLAAASSFAFSMICATKAAAAWRMRGSEVGRSGAASIPAETGAGTVVHWRLPSPPHISTGAAPPTSPANQSRQPHHTCSCIVVCCLAVPLAAPRQLSRTRRCCHRLTNFLPVLWLHIPPDR